MRILYYNEGEDPAVWLPALARALPEAEIRLWTEGDTAPADYALVWKPPPAMLAGRTQLKAIFNLAAGVDQLLSMETLPQGVPIYRLEDAGMAIQMAEYATEAVLHYYRRFDAYARQQRDKKWQALDPLDRQHFSIGIMGMGIMGTRIAQALRYFDFPVRGWSRHRKAHTDILSYAGVSELPDFLHQLRVLICVLPLTKDTQGILNKDCFAAMHPGSFLINLGRGAHLDENHLLAALASRQLAGATLDVFEQEPLAESHPFWTHPDIRITPHIGAVTFFEETIAHVASRLKAIEQGIRETPAVNPQRGY